MHVENKKQAANLRDGIVLSSGFLTQGGGHTVTGEMRRIEIEIGEVVELALGVYVISTTWTLMRIPPGSTAVLQGARLSGVNKPGVHVVVARTDGGFERVIELCAYSRAQMFGKLAVTAERRLHQRAFLNDPNRTSLDIIEFLEKV